jgi:hypothetical protein
MARGEPCSWHDLTAPYCTLSLGTQVSVHYLETDTQAEGREACIAKGDPPMTPAQIRELALALFTVIFESGDVREPKPVRDRCIRTCQQRGFDLTSAAMISEALMGYVYGWSSRGAYLVAHQPKAQAILNCAMGGHDDIMRYTLPVGARLTPYAIAEMIGWVLTVSIDKRP